MFSEKTTSHNNKPIHYRVIGGGQPVVLLHGFGETSRIWKNQEDAFPGYKLIIPDLPGTGASEMQDNMSMEGMADAVRAVVKNELNADHKKRIILVGHSMGGYITLAYVDKYPETLIGFSLFHSSAYADSAEKKETRKKGINFIKEHGAIEFIRTTIPNLYGPSAKKDKPRMIEQHINDSADFTPKALITYYESMMERPDRTAILQSANCPVLFIFGKHDNAVPLEDGLKQCHLPNVSYVHILEDAGHMGMVEEAEKSNQILKQYFTDLANP
jgi:pimeloyl-ACP methyl ester carboxylesterase